MADQDSWESKRQEVWQRIVGAEKVLENLKEKLSAVEIVANNKISENEQTAVDSAKKASDGAEKVAQVVKQAEELSANIATFNQGVANANSNVAIIKKQAEEATANSQSIATAKITSETEAKEIVVLQDKAKKLAEDAEAKWTTTNQQVQNIAVLNAQASADAATAKTAREGIENLQKEISQIKSDIVKMQTEWEKEFELLQTRHDKDLTELYAGREQVLNNLINEKTKDLSLLNEKYLQEFEARTQEIESLLPGATSAGLASAFHDRKLDIEKNKKWWAWLLIGSAVALIAFGFISLSSWGTQIGIASSFAARTVIVAGLILLEEFARRNFNIVSRLAESYAYKEALAKSYFGYNKQMEQIPMPSSDLKEVKGYSALMKTFLDKLEDEPGKHVFDKEKHVIGIGAAMDKLSPNNPDGAAGKAVEELSKGNILTKISWPIVAVVAILAIAGCIIAYLLKGQ